MVSMAFLDWFALIVITLTTIGVVGRFLKFGEYLKAGIPITILTSCGGCCGSPGFVECGRFDY